MEIDPNAHYRVWFGNEDHPSYFYGDKLKRVLATEAGRFITGWENTNED